MIRENVTRFQHSRLRNLNPAVPPPPCFPPFPPGEPCPFYFFKPLDTLSIRSVDQAKQISLQESQRRNAIATQVAAYLRVLFEAATRDNRISSGLNATRE
jgi:hypothetical protein